MNHFITFGLIALTLTACSQRKDQSSTQSGGNDLGVTLKQPNEAPKTTPSSTPSASQASPVPVPEIEKSKEKQIVLRIDCKVSNEGLDYSLKGMFTIGKVPLANPRYKSLEGRMIMSGKTKSAFGTRMMEKEIQTFSGIIGHYSDESHVANIRIKEPAARYSIGKNYNMHHFIFEISRNGKMHAAVVTQTSSKKWFFESEEVYLPGVSMTDCSQNPSIGL